jgi:hypothetical protein
MIERDKQIVILKNIQDLFKDYTLSEQIDLLERINKDNRRKNSVSIANFVRTLKIGK